MTVRIIEGDALDVLRSMDGASVHCCVTSPPYWGLRDYGVDGQLGLEKTPEEYVARLVEIMREVRRVLRDDGTFWLNLGDSYANDGKWGGVSGGEHVTALHGRGSIGRTKTTTGLKPKDLVGIPWRVAFALQADGWWLRSDIIWSKPNPMPESVTDRPTKSHEYVFMLAKSEKYSFDQDAVREPFLKGDGIVYVDTPKNRAMGLKPTRQYGDRLESSGRNIRNVWTIATQPFPGAHFAVFPPKLVEPCIKAGTSERGCCSECGAPVVRVVERSSMEVREGPGRVGLRNAAVGSGSRTACTGTMTKPPESRTTGWRPSCSCDAPTKPCIVLDPFAGAGTTGLVADRLGRDVVLIEINPEYAAMARERIRGDAPLFAKVT